MKLDNLIITNPDIRNVRRNITILLCWHHRRAAAEGGAPPVLCNAIEYIPSHIPYNVSLNWV